MVLRWKLWTRSALSGTTSARCSLSSWVVTPTGQRLVWHRCDWMHPTANMKPRAELHQSAPSAMARAMADADTSLPLAPILIRCRMPAPTRVFCTSISPSTSGVPSESENSSGAAPVPPSAPSTTMKSG